MKGHNIMPKQNSYNYIWSLLLNTVCNLNVLKLYDCLLNVSVHGFMTPSFDWTACSPVLFS